MVKEWDITIPQLTGERTRRAYVYLPQGYEEEQERRYPVMYMFDGHNVFFDSHATHGKSWGLAEYLDFFDVPLIVAAVECNHHPDNGRLSEYSPYDFTDPEFGSVTGRGEITMEWLANTFKPLIDRRFRTIPWREYTFIAEESASYMQRVGAYVGDKMNEVLSGTKVGRTDAAVLTAANIADELFKAQAAAEQLRSQIKGYLDEASKAQSEVSELKREIFRLQQRLDNRNKG